MTAKEINPEDEFYPFDVADHFYRQFPDNGWTDEEAEDKS